MLENWVFLGPEIFLFTVKGNRSAASSPWGRSCLAGQGIKPKGNWRGAKGDAGEKAHDSAVQDLPSQLFPEEKNLTELIEARPAQPSPASGAGGKALPQHLPSQLPSLDIQQRSSGNKE